MLSTIFLKINSVLPVSDMQQQCKYSRFLLAYKTAVVIFQDLLPLMTMILYIGILLISTISSKSLITIKITIVDYDLGAYNHIQPGSENGSYILLSIS